MSKQPCEAPHFQVKRKQLVTRRGRRKWCTSSSLKETYHHHHHRDHDVVSDKQKLSKQIQLKNLKVRAAFWGFFGLCFCWSQTVKFVKKLSDFIYKCCSRFGLRREGFIPLSFDSICQMSVSRDTMFPKPTSFWPCISVNCNIFCFPATVRCCITAEQAKRKRLCVWD